MQSLGLWERKQIYNGHHGISFTVPLDIWLSSYLSHEPFISLHPRQQKRKRNGITMLHMDQYFWFGSAFSITARFLGSMYCVPVISVWELKVYIRSLSLDPSVLSLPCPCYIYILYIYIYIYIYIYVCVCVCVCVCFTLNTFRWV